jgi:predicted aspartyl protease
MRVILAIFLFIGLASKIAQAEDTVLALQQTAQGHLIAPVTINNKGPFSFIVDTAASRTVISSGLATTLSLARLQSHQGMLAAAGGATPTDVYRLGTLRLGEKTWEIGPVLILPDTTMQDDFFGILGLDVLAAQPVLFDFKTRTVTLADKTTARKIRKKYGWYKIIAKRNFAGFLVVNMKIRGKRVKAIIDSGARRSIGNVKLGNLLENLSPASILAREQIVTGVALPQVPARTGIARSVNMQTLKWDNAQILVADLAVFETLGLDDQPALIVGLDFLQSTSAVMLDFSRERLWIKP